MSKTRKEVANKIQNILDALDLNVMKASRELELNGFDELESYLEGSSAPDFKFLEKFAKKFNVCLEYFFDDNVAPFKMDTINCSIKQLIENSEQYEAFFIIESNDEQRHTKIIAKERGDTYKKFAVDFCIGEDYIMEYREQEDLFGLYKFYSSNKWRIKLLSLSAKDYDALLSGEIPAKKILSDAKISFKLFDLLELNEELVKKYEPYLKDVLSIIKYKKKEAENDKNTI